MITIANLMGLFLFRITSLDIKSAQTRLLHQIYQIKPGDELSRQTKRLLGR